MKKYDLIQINLYFDKIGSIPLDLISNDFNILEVFDEESFQFKYFSDNKLMISYDFFISNLNKELNYLDKYIKSNTILGKLYEINLTGIEIKIKKKKTIKISLEDELESNLFLDSEIIIFDNEDNFEKINLNKLAFRKGNYMYISKLDEYPGTIDAILEIYKENNKKLKFI